MVTILQSHLGNNKNPIETEVSHERTSDRYKLINTEEVIDTFIANGLQIVGESYASVRKKSMDGFQKHIVLFSNKDLDLGEEKLQLMLVNSHAGLGSTQVGIGCFRMVCANGLVDGTNKSIIRIRHTGDVASKMDEAIKYQLERLPKVAADIKRMKEIELSTKEINKLTLELAKIRTGNEDLTKVGNVSALRDGDVGSDLWTVFNRVQEASVRGGLLTQDPETGKWTSIRAIRSPVSNLKVNREMWEKVANDYLDLGKAA